MLRKISIGAQRHGRSYGLSFLLVSAIVTWPLAAPAQHLRSHADAARILTLPRVTVVDGAVTGELWNRSNHTVRDVQLFIRYTWLWDDERHPGKLDPGTSTYYTIAKEIAPGARLPFTFTPTPSLPKIAGGHFQTTVSVAGYTEIIPQTK